MTKFYLITTNFLTILIFKFLKISIEYEIYYKNSHNFMNL